MYILYITYIYIYIYIYIQTKKNEKITLCEYTTQSFMFDTFTKYTSLFSLKRQNCY